MSELPIAIGVVTGPLTRTRSGGWEARLIVRCPYCGGKHVHGWPVRGHRETQRHSGCGREYHIRPARRGEPGYERHAYRVNDNGDVRIN
jgi:hypothetical protein